MTTGPGYYSLFLYHFRPKDNSLDPLAFAFSGQLIGHYQIMNLLLQNYYYVVYFTSKLADPSTGKSMFQVNRFYSS
jgi:hypothetical protein